jgi:hypothetical protein
MSSTAKSNCAKNIRNAVCREVEFDHLVGHRHDDSELWDIFLGAGRAAPLRRRRWRSVPHRLRGGGLAQRLAPGAGADQHRFMNFVFGDFIGDADKTEEAMFPRNRVRTSWKGTRRQRWQSSRARTSSSPGPVAVDFRPVMSNGLSAPRAHQNRSRRPN